MCWGVSLCPQDFFSVQILTQVLLLDDFFQLVSFVSLVSGGLVGLAWA